MLHNAKHTVILLICALALLTCVSCLERQESIAVAPDGTVTLEADWNGSAADFADPISGPTAPEWTILEDRIDSVSGKTPKHKLRARKVIPYGQPLPSSYAAAGSEYANNALQFPSEVRYWTEGNRTYYEFKRTYEARRFRAYSVTETDELWDADLEERVLDQGIFNVSEEDRRKYLEQFGLAFAYQEWRFMWESLASLVQDGAIDTKQLSAIQFAAQARLDEEIGDEQILAIFKHDEEQLAKALEDLRNEVQSIMREIISKQLGGNIADMLRRYENKQSGYRHEYKVTEALTSHEFSVFIDMPGTVIETNGMLDFEEPSKAMWMFNGDELHDKDIPIYALSVVEH